MFYKTNREIIIHYTNHLPIYHWNFIPRMGLSQKTLLRPQILFRMKNTILFAFIFFTTLLVHAPIANISAQKKSNPPSFNDNGKTIDSLRKVYNCESITYENSADKKMVDSCLTVYLINSKNAPLENGANRNVHLLKNIALAILPVLKEPEYYKIIYVYFVTKFSENGIEKIILTAGLEMSTKGL